MNNLTSNDTSSSDNHPKLHNPRKKNFFYLNSRYRAFLIFFSFTISILFFSTLYLGALNSNEYQHKSLVLEKLNIENKKIKNYHESLQLELSAKKNPNFLKRNTPIDTKNEDSNLRKPNQGKLWAITQDKLFLLKRGDESTDINDVEIGNINN